MGSSSHDEHEGYIRETLGEDVTHRCNPSLHNRSEQDHHGIKRRSYPTRRFGNFGSALRFSRAFDGQRQDFGSIQICANVRHH